MIIYLTCHGETEWNKKEILQGHKDSNLTKKGKLSAESKGESLINKKIQIIYSSDLGRCLSTANIINKYTKVKIIKTSKLREMNFGEFNGKQNEIFLKEFDLRNIYKKTPNGESFSDFRKRIIEFLKFLNKKKYKKVLLITHNGVAKVILNKSRISKDLLYKTKL